MHPTELPKTMKAVVIYEEGGPEVLKLERRTIPKAEPSSSGKNKPYNSFFNKIEIGDPLREIENFERFLTSKRKFRQKI